MADFRRSRFPTQTDRRLEIVTGKSFSANQIGTTKTYAAAQTPASSTRSPTPDFPAPRVKSRSSSKGWAFNDPEMKRRKRVASYKVYAVEGKVKASLRKGIRWIKNKCSDIVHGW